MEKNWVNRTTYLEQYINKFGKPTRAAQASLQPHVIEGLAELALIENEPGVLRRLQMKKGVCCTQTDCSSWDSWRCGSAKQKAISEETSDARCRFQCVVRCLRQSDCRRAAKTTPESPWFDVHVGTESKPRTHLRESRWSILARQDSTSRFVLGCEGLLKRGYRFTEEVGPKHTDTGGTVTVSGDQREYGKVYITYNMSLGPNSTSQGSFTGKAMAIDNDGNRNAAIRGGVWKREGNKITMHSLDDVTDGN